QLPLLLTREGSAAGQGLQVGIQPLELAAATLVHLRFPPPDENRYVTLSIPRMREGSVGCAYGTRITETSADRAGALMDRPSDRQEDDGRPENTRRPTKTSRALRAAPGLLAQSRHGAATGR